jgi:multisubunit Na+/H+ antiporter MnhB subunit
MAIVVYLILLAATLIAFKFLFSNKKKDYFLKKGVKYEKQKMLLGLTNMFTQKKSFPDIINKWYSDFREEK